MRAISGTLLLLALAAPAAAEVAVTDAWVRGTVAAQRSSGAFMTLMSTENATVVSAASPAAKLVEIHEMKMEKDVMRMRAVRRLALPASKAVELKPGGYHIMLMDLRGPLKAGERVPITLRIEGKGGQVSEIQVDAEVRELHAGSHHGH